MIEFILDRYNYWIAIILMLTGLYIVFSRGNLVKKIIGLNFFQTSVFIYYISIGKIAGGTAPIIMGGHDDHIGGGEAEHGAGATGIDGVHASDAAGHASQTTNSLHDKIANSPAASANDLSAITATNNPSGHGDAATSLHTLPDELADKMSNDVLAHAAKAAHSSDPLTLDVGDNVESIINDLVQHTDAVSQANDHGATHVSAIAEVIYSNPLPHVLILTAIVVGVATTAVGLALAVRIREAYGTIEEDELEAADEIAEFGKAKVAPLIAGDGTA